MQIFINIFFLAASWAAGLILVSLVVQNIKDYKADHKIERLLKACGLILAAVITLVLVAVFNNLIGCLFMAGGYLIATLTVIDPIKMTQEKADEIGRKSAQQAALKEQAEEQKREDERIRKENARIYAEEQKRLSKKS